MIRTSFLECINKHKLPKQIWKENCENFCSKGKRNTFFIKKKIKKNLLVSRVG